MIQYKDEIPVQDYLRLRKSVGWMSISQRQAENAVSRCFLALSARDGEQVVGMMRVLWNGDYCAYITDVIVEEAYRHQGIATAMIRQSMERVRAQLEGDEAVKLFLTASVGMEPFYEQFGFGRRPSEHCGAGMEQWIFREE